MARTYPWSSSGFVPFPPDLTVLEIIQKFYLIPKREYSRKYANPAEKLEQGDWP